MIRCFQRTASTSPPGKSATRVGAVLVGAPTPKQLFNSRAGRHLPCLRQPASQGAQAHQGDGPPSPLRRRRAGALASERRRLRGDGFQRTQDRRQSDGGVGRRGSLLPRFAPSINGGQLRQRAQAVKAEPNLSSASREAVCHGCRARCRTLAAWSTALSARWQQPSGYARSRARDRPRSRQASIRSSNGRLPGRGGVGCGLRNALPTRKESRPA